MKRNLFTVLIFVIVFSFGTVPQATGQEKERLSTLGKVYVSGFQFDGNTVFTDEELSVLVSAFENREIAVEELHEASNRITKHYYSAGYVNSGAMIPDQEVRDGKILLRIVEGRLVELSVNGNSRLRDGYVRTRLERGGLPFDSPLNIRTLQERLKMLKQDPRIENVNADLKRGLKRGESELAVEVTEAKPWYGWAEFNNHNSPSIGPWRAELGIGHMNISGWGDRLEASYGLTEGLDDFSAKYEFPVTRWDTMIYLEADIQESTVVAEPFSEVDIRSETTAYAAGVTHPVFKSLSSEFALGLELSRHQTKTFLNDDPFPFTGSGDAENTVSVLKFTQEWAKRDMKQVIAVHSGIHYGMDMLDATILDTEPDGKFLSWLGQFQWVRRLEKPASRLICKLNVQLADDPLLPVEKFGIGGASTVRGYRENQMTTDNGFVTGIEWQVPFYQLRLPKISKNPGDGEIQVAPFFDLGKGWNNDTPDPDTDMIYSAGAGLRWIPGKSLFAEIYWGFALEDVENASEHDIQDDGIHLRIRGEF